MTFDESVGESMVPALIKARPGITSDVYDALVKRLSKVGTFEVEEKKTSLHLSNGTAFAGVHPRASGLLLNLRLDKALSSARVRKVEQVSKNRFHNEVLLESPDQVDDELVGWLAAAYKMGKS